MPTLPKVEELSRRKITPSTGVVSYQAGTVEAAEAELGNTVGTVGGRVGRMAAYYGDQADRKKAKDAILSLREQSIGLEAETQKTLGTAAFDKGFIDNRNEAYTTLSNSISEGMDDRTRRYYTENMRGLQMTYQKSVLSHSISEEQKMGALLFKKEAVVDAQEASMNYDDTGRTLDIVRESEESVRDYMETQGITDPAVIDSEVLIRSSGIHKAVISAMLEDGEVKLAAAHASMWDAKGEISPEAMKDINAMIEPESNYQKGIEISDAAMQEFYTGTDEVQIINNIEAKTETKAEYAAAMNAYNTKKSAANSEFTQTGSQILEDYAKGGKGVNSREFAELAIASPKHAHAVRTSINQEDNRRYTKANRTPAKPTSEQRLFYAKLLTHPDTMQLTPEILKMALPTIGISQYEAALKHMTSQKITAANKNAAELKSYKLPANRVKLGLGAETSADERRVIQGNMAAEVEDFLARYGRVPNKDEENDIILRHTFIQEDDTLWMDGEEVITGEAALDEDERSYPKGLQELLAVNNDFETNYQVWVEVKKYMELNPGVTLYDALSKYELDKEKLDKDAFAEARKLYEKTK